MPKTWPLQRKDRTFIIKGIGAQKDELSIPLLVVLRDLLKVLDNSKEAKKLLVQKNIFINDKIVVETKTKVGLFDRIYIKKLDKHFSLYFTDKGKLTILEIDKHKSESKPCRIVGKKVLKGKKLQINCNDGRNFIVQGKTDYNVGDTLIIELKTNKITHHLKLGKGAFVLIFGGKSIGQHGKIENIEKQNALVHIKDKITSVPKKNLFVLEEKEFEK